MSNLQKDPLLQVETTCGSLLYELKIIWDEVGETDTERDKMLLELEQECLEVYRRKVDRANQSRAKLRQAIAYSEAQIAAICSAMGERPVHIRQSDQPAGSLKEELRLILPQLEEMQKRKSERHNQFHEVLEEIEKITHEIHGSGECIPSKIVLDETDLSLKNLEELHRKLHELQKDKNDRMEQVQDHLITLNSLCSVLGMDFTRTVSEIHPSLSNSGGPKSISNGTIEHLAAAVQKLWEIKLQRMQRLQDLATNLLELWNLMDTPIEEQQKFQNVTCNLAASEHEITEPNTLSIEFISNVEAEVSRLEEFKASKMKELVLKKRSELEQTCWKTHMVPEGDSAMDTVIEAIESGAVDPAYVLEQIEHQIAKVKEESLTRKEILEKVEKWLVACDEECWLEEYNRDDNRYNAGRGAHLTLKRAEKARAMVNKLPAMVDGLTSKVTAWEKERGVEFTYDGVRLLSMLEEYSILREEKEQERRMLRDQKKLQGQLIAEQEALYGSKPSPVKPQSVKKAPRMSTGGASSRGASSRRLSLGSTMHQTPKPSRKSDRVHLLDHHNNGAAAIHGNYIRTIYIYFSYVFLISLKQSFGAVNYCDVEPVMARKPFSPISSTPSTKTTNTTNVTDDHNSTHGEMLKKTVNNTLFSTPLKRTTSVQDEENWTPKAMTIPTIPSTPLTVSVPMQTAATPAPPVSSSAAVHRALELPEEIEYSFEERRAGFVVPKTLHLKYGIQV